MNSLFPYLARFKTNVSYVFLSTVKATKKTKTSAGSLSSIFVKAFCPLIFNGRYCRPPPAVEKCVVGYGWLFCTDWHVLWRSCGIYQQFAKANLQSLVICQGELRKFVWAIFFRCRCQDRILSIYSTGRGQT